MDFTSPWSAREWLTDRNGIVAGKQRYRCKECGCNAVSNHLLRGTVLTHWHDSCLSLKNGNILTCIYILVSSLARGGRLPTISVPIPALVNNSSKMQFSTLPSIIIAFSTPS